MVNFALLKRQFTNYMSIAINYVLIAVHVHVTLAIIHFIGLALVLNNKTYPLKVGLDDVGDINQSLLHIS